MPPLCATHVAWFIHKYRHTKFIQTLAFFFNKHWKNQVLSQIIKSYCKIYSSILIRAPPPPFFRQYTIQNSLSLLSMYPWIYLRNTRISRTWSSRLLIGAALCTCWWTVQAWHCVEHWSRCPWKISGYVHFRVGL